MKYRNLSINALLSIAFILQACGADLEPQTLPDELIKIRVSIRYNTGFGPIIIAQEEGFFAEQGLEIEFIPAPRSAEAIAALLTGELDVHAGTFTSGLFNAMAQGERLKITANKGVFDPEGCTYQAYSVRKDLFDNGEVTSAEDLVGRRVSFKAEIYSGYILDAALSASGFTSADVEIHDLPGSAEFEALERGAVDAVYHGEPDVTRVSNMGLGVVLIRAEEVLPYASWGTLTFGPSLLEDNSEAGQRFMVAYLQGVRQYNEGKTERNLEIMAAASELDMEILEQSCWPPIVSDGQINVQSALDFQVWAQESGLLDSIATEEQFWDSQFIEYANEALQ